MSAIKTVNFEAGSVIFKEGEKPDGVYFVISGKVEISRNQPGGKVILANLAGDTVFGEMALIDNKPRSASVLALEPTECMLGTPDNFKSLIDGLDPALKAAIMQIVTVVSEKNKFKKSNMTPPEIAAFNALKRKVEQIKARIVGNPPLMKKIGELDPFLNSVFNSLIRLL